MKVALSLVLVLSVSIVPAFASKGEGKNKKKPELLYKVGFTIKNAKSDGFDDVGQRVATQLQKQKTLAAGCVDLRSLGSASGGGNWSGDYTLMTHAKPSAKELAEFTKAICMDYLGCTVTPSVTEYDIAKLAVAAYPHGDAHSHKRTEPVSMHLDGKLPKFSASCESGKHQDSWNDAASTPEARAYLQKIGIQISQARTLSLTDAKTGDEIWTFGFPDHQRDTAAIGIGGGKSKGGSTQTSGGGG